MDGETELEMVRRHVREGNEHIKQQAKLVARLQEVGAPTDMAIILLDNFNDLQRLHKEHLARLQAD